MRILQFALWIGRLFLLYATLWPFAYAACEGDCRDGYGVRTFGSGDRYAGYWKDGKIEGYGVYEWQNSGNRYEGEWKNNRRQGCGKLTWGDGGVTEGCWANHKYAGSEGCECLKDTPEPEPEPEPEPVPVSEPAPAPLLPKLRWLQPPPPRTSQKHLELEVCVHSAQQATYRTYLNRKLISVNAPDGPAATRGLRVVPAGRAADVKCDEVLSPVFELRAGENQIRIDVETPRGNDYLAHILDFDPPVAPQPRSPRFALVIGNGDYSKLPLRNPVNDASAVAATLRNLGFDVSLHTNLTGNAMRRAILEFGVSLSMDKDSVGLFYYAGHAVQVKDKNYLIPLHANIRGAYEVELEAVDLQRTMVEFERAQNRLNIVILDACRDNPFPALSRSLSGGGLAVASKPYGTFIAYAAAPGSVADDGNGAHGLYTEQLLKVLPTPDLKLEDVFKRVRSAVRKKSRNRQTPWDSSSIEGDFYFVPRK